MLSALGVEGWATTKVHDWEPMQPQERQCEHQCEPMPAHTAAARAHDGHGSCVSFSSELISRDMRDDDIQKERQAEYVSRTRMAAIEAVIGQEKVSPLRSLGLLEEIGDAVCPVTTDDHGDAFLPIDNWVDTSILITLDSGCCEP